MKKILLYLLVSFPIFLTAQSISASKILQYASSQNIFTISSELKQLGFQTRTDNSEGYPIYQFAKKTSRGVEKLEVGRNSELFMLTYKADYAVYKILKNKILTSDYQHSYNYRNAKYYENGYTRVGVDDINGIISVFKPIKK